MEMPSTMGGIWKFLWGAGVAELGIIFCLHRVSASWNHIEFYGVLLREMTIGNSRILGVRRNPN